ncbi:MAG: class I SAM-dependent methyltransferase [Eubacteriales bacterium]|nr:class I SAM-dependent methyltransferase [Eubacteriales bacterium]
MSNPYTHLAQYYDFFADPESEVQIIRKIKEYITDFSQASLLDLGCGTGRLTGEFAPFFSQVYGLDNSFEMLEIFKERQGSIADSKIDLRLADISTDKLPQADVVIALTDVLNHLSPAKLPLACKNIEQAFKEHTLFIFDLLKLDYLREERGDFTFYSELGNEEMPSTCFVWENSWDEELWEARSQFTFFHEEGGLYRRNLAELTEYYYEVEELFSYFKELSLLDSLDLPERKLFIAR